MGDYKIIIIGSGISGCVLAERYANCLNKKVLLIEKRNHIGGNCYDELDKTGHLIPKYGPHFFHTNFKEVWEYVNNFSSWNKYEHKVLADINGRGKYVPVPVNINTINIIFNLKLKNEEEVKQWLSKNTIKYKKILNSEQLALSSVGKDLYNKIFKNYTKKQWDLWPKQLDPLVLKRIPVHYSFDDRYFTDAYQGMPLNGYGSLFKNMLENPNIKILLNTDFIKIKNNIKKFEKLFYTGPADRYFDYKFGKLQYRSLLFKRKVLNLKFYQKCAQINYPNNYKYTRIIEPKHATFQRSSDTVIIKEYSRKTGEPFYPIPSEKNIKIYFKYKKKLLKLEKNNIYFIGRLANYAYINMDQAFKNSLDLFYNLNKI